MRVVGIDPSLTATGVAGIGGKLSTITYPKTVTGDLRLHHLDTTITNLVITAHLVVMEDLPTHAKAAGITGMVQGVIRSRLCELEIPYLIATPATLKQFATGKGNATKPDMRMEWFKRTGEDVRDDNQVDAAWLRQIGLHHVGKGLRLPQAHTAALGKVKTGPFPLPTLADLISQ